jgi:hypothetical protein
MPCGDPRTIYFRNNILSSGVYIETNPLPPTSADVISDEVKNKKRGIIMRNKSDRLRKKEERTGKN